MATRYISQDPSDTHWGLKHQDGRSVVFKFSEFRRQPRQISFAGQTFIVERRRYARKNRKAVWQIVISNNRIGWDADYAVSIIWPRELKDA